MLCKVLHIVNAIRAAVGIFEIFLALVHFNQPSYIPKTGFLKKQYNILRFQL